MIELSRNDRVDSLFLVSLEDPPLKDQIAEVKTLVFLSFSYSSGLLSALP